MDKCVLKLNFNANELQTCQNGFEHLWTRLNYKSFRARSFKKALVARANH